MFAAWISSDEMHGIYGLRSTERVLSPISVDGYWVVSTLKLVIISDVVTFLEKHQGDVFRSS